MILYWIKLNWNIYAMLMYYSISWIRYLYRRSRWTTSLWTTFSGRAFCLKSGWGEFAVNRCSQKTITISIDILTGEHSFGEDQTANSTFRRTHSCSPVCVKLRANRSCEPWWTFGRVYWFFDSGGVRECEFTRHHDQCSRSSSNTDSTVVPGNNKFIIVLWKMDHEATFF